MAVGPKLDSCDCLTFVTLVGYGARYLLLCDGTTCVNKLNNVN